MSWQGRRCLVTGGAGFGGSHLVEQLLMAGATVVLLDREYDSRSYLRIAGLDRQATCHRGDVRDLEFVKGVLAKCSIDCVFHLAAEALVPRANAEPFDALSTNVMGTCVVLEAVRSVNSAVPVVFASSGAVYGPTRDVEPLQEHDTSRAPSNIYAASKRSADAIVLAYAAVYGMNAACCRFMNTYGPGDLNFSRLVPGAIRRLMLAEPLDFGFREDGGNRLSYLYVTDMARAYLAVASQMAVARGQAFNFGPNDVTETRNVVRLLSRLWDGRDREAVFTGPPQGVVKRLDITKATQRLSWKPTIPLEVGLLETFTWYKQHRTIALPTA